MLQFNKVRLYFIMVQKTKFADSMEIFRGNTLDIQVLRLFHSAQL